MLKHLSDGFDIGNTFVCGKELLGDDGLPTNYVVEPTTTLKGTADDFESWYGNSRSEAVTDASFTPVAEYLSDDLLQGTAGAHDKALTIGYGCENTYPAALADHRRVTGLMLRAVYVPSGMTAGSDFWRVRHATLDFDKEHYFAAESEALKFVEENPGYLSPIYHKGGICYYHFYFRHRLENNSEAIVYPMEYGTVRNHIYRAGLVFRAPGTTDITTDEPEQHIAELYVRRWNFRRLNTIIM